MEGKIRMQEEKLMFSYCTMVNQELFFIDSQNGLPAKMNPDNGDVSYCSVMDNLILKAENICDIRTFGDRVYALETSGEDIIIFDMERFRCQYIPLQCAYHPCDNFVAFEQYGSDLYIFPRYGNKICILNTTNNEISEITDYFDEITEMQCACRAGNKVWLLPCDAEVIGCYDLVNRRMQIYEMQRKIENCVHAVIVDENIYILNRFGIIYVWNTQELKLDEEKILETEYSDEKSTYSILVHAGNKLIVLPSLSDEIKILDMLTGSIEIYQDYPKDFLYYNEGYIAGWSKYTGICQDDNNYYCAMRRGNYLLKISKRDGILSWIKPNIPSKEERSSILISLQKKRFRDAIAAGEYIFLETEMDIGTFLEEVPKKRHISKRTNSGEIIFEKVK